MCLEWHESGASPHRGPAPIEYATRLLPIFRDSELLSRQAAVQPADERQVAHEPQVAVAVQPAHEPQVAVAVQPAHEPQVAVAVQPAREPPASVQPADERQVAREPQVADVVRSACEPQVSVQTPDEQQVAREPQVADVVRSACEPQASVQIPAELQASPSLRFAYLAQQTYAARLSALLERYALFLGERRSSPPVELLCLLLGEPLSGLLEPCKLRLPALPLPLRDR